MNINRINAVQNWLINIVNSPNCLTLPISNIDRQNIQNELIGISQDISKEFSFFSQELFILKDNMFVGYGTINPTICGQIIEILKTLQHQTNQSQNSIWDLLHPDIIKVSKKLFEDGHYANAAGDAFIEINDRVKRLFQIVKPNEANIPDGQAAMNTVFSDNNPLVEFCDRSTDTGRNIQKGYMQMLTGAMSALRNPKAHANITITADDAMRRLLYASMLMYKIDEAAGYSNIQE